MKRNRLGFTIVEIVLATALMALVIGVAFAVFNLSNRSQTVAGAANALQAAMFFQEQFEADLRALAPVKTAPIRYQPNLPVGQTRKPRISWWVYDLANDPATADEPKMPVKPVVYSLDIPPEKKSALPQRAFDNKPASVGSSPFTSLAFDPFLGPTGPLIRVTVWVAKDVESKEPPIIHTFLARIPSSPSGGAIKFDPRVDFSDTNDAPTDQEISAE